MPDHDHRPHLHAESGQHEHRPAGQEAFERRGSEGVRDHREREECPGDEDDGIEYLDPETDLHAMDQVTPAPSPTPSPTPTPTPRMPSDG